MACISLGKVYIKGKEQDVMLVCGMITKDAELAQSRSGKRFAKASIIARENANGTTDFFTLTAWRGNTDALLQLKKGDMALCVGTFNKNERDGKVFLSLTCDFVSKTGAGCFANGTSMSAEDVLNKFQDLSGKEDEEGELPF